MSEMKHTPGPWTPMVRPPASFADHGLRALAQVWGGWIVAVPKRLVDRLGHDAEANARLIAAAPELLEALEELLTAVDKACGTAIPQGSFAAARQAARDAIAKATGKKDGE